MELVYRYSGMSWFKIVDLTYGLLVGQASLDLMCRVMSKANVRVFCNVDNASLRKQEFTSGETLCADFLLPSIGVLPFYDDAGLFSEASPLMHRLPLADPTQVEAAAPRTDPAFAGPTPVSTASPAFECSSQ